MDERVVISPPRAALLWASQRQPLVPEASDDLCPPWWPRRPRSPRGPLRAGEVHIDVRAADRIYAALTLLASCFQLSDEVMAKDVRTVALAHLRAGAQVLAGGAARAWEPTDDVCPPWPWGWHAALSSTGELDDGSRVPARAAELLDALGLLQAYNLAAKIGEASARDAATTAIGQALAEHVAAVARVFA